MTRRCTCSSLGGVIHDEGCVADTPATFASAPFSTGDVCRMLGVTAATVYYWRDTFRITPRRPSVVGGKPDRYTAAQVSRFVDVARLRGAGFDRKAIREILRNDDDPRWAVVRRDGENDEMEAINNG